jgi:hypothetical protein
MTATYKASAVYRLIMVKFKQDFLSQEIFHFRRSEAVVWGNQP